MSEVGLEARHWRHYIQDMIDFCRKVLKYTDAIDQNAFVGDSLRYDATLRNLELVGEAATHIPAEVRAAHPEIRWRRIVGTRNRLAHGYLGLDDDVIWDIIQSDIPQLLPALRTLLDQTSEDGE